MSRQRQDCLALCAERGWEVATTYVDNDVSASSAKPRPEYQRMLAAIEAGEVDVLVAWHVDRLTRKLTELEHLIELAERTGLRITTVTGDVDLSTDAGRLVGRILASVARGEVERKGARQRRAQQQAAEAGRPAGGRRAFGYTADGATVVEDEAVLVKAAYTDLLAGASLKGIAKGWNEQGALTTMGGTWRHDNVRNLLKNPRYAGLRTYRGEVVGQATWPALVDEDTHATAVALLALPGRRTTDSTARKYLLPGIARCWKCGATVATGHTRHGKRVYVCRGNKCISRKADPVDELVEAVVVARLSAPDAAEVFTNSTPDLARHRARVLTLQERLDDLAVALEEGVLSLAAVRRSSQRLRVELEAAQAAVDAMAAVDAVAPVVTAPDVAAAWEGLDLARQRAIIDKLVFVTLERPEPGRRAFDPASVRIEWKTTS